MNKGMYDLAARHSGGESASESDNDESKSIVSGGASANATANNDGAAYSAGKEYTTAEIEQKLEKYLAIPKKLWPLLTKGTHIRYIKLNGEFKPGGFVHSYTIKDDGRQILQLKNGFNPKANSYITWPIDFKQIKAIFKKIHPSSLIEISMIKDMLTTHSIEINKLKKQIANR